MLGSKKSKIISPELPNHALSPRGCRLMLAALDSAQRPLKIGDGEKTPLGGHVWRLRCANHAVRCKNGNDYSAARTVFLISISVLVLVCGAHACRIADTVVLYVQV
jgi:hypothetical protein